MRIKHNSIIWYPLAIAISIVTGILIGNYISTQKFILDKDRKINSVLNLIQSEYVDSVDIKQLVEMSIPQIITNLDPHSYYIPENDVKEENDKLNSSVSGIGVTFFMYRDTARIEEIIPNGPAEKAGLMTGDRIISVDGQSIVGTEISDKGIQSKIRGDKGSKVVLGIKRNTAKEPLKFTIIRGDIPINTVDAAYMLDKQTGYVKVTKFGRSTYSEFLSALIKLKKEGANSFVVDLRGNAGGYMEMAILMVNEFLPQGELIVYTKGRKMREDIQVWSDSQGSFHEEQVVVLIDEYSASTSEIMAGALQDNDRGLVVGRRSFGKGLVQKQIYLPDSSVVRLTTARYYTPSHRCIQKDYQRGKEDDYSMEVYNRYTHGELYNADSIKMDKSQVYKTANGRTVYGGGGIVPDIFVANDTTGITSYYLAVANLGLIHKFVYSYVDINRQMLKDIKDIDRLQRILPGDDALLYDFVTFAKDNGVPIRWYYISQSKALIIRQLRALIIRDTLGMEAFYRYYNKSDKTINTALKAIRENKAKYPISVEIQGNKH